MKDPDYGYIENITGFTAVCLLSELGIYKSFIFTSKKRNCKKKFISTQGLIRTGCLPENFGINLIPADILASTVLAVTWIRSQQE